MAHEPRLLEHEYDGIREYDNPTPGWWHALFFLFVGFAAFYMFMSIASPYYSSPIEGHDATKLAWTKKKFGTIGDLSGDSATIVRYFEDDDLAAEWMPYAASLFKTNCVSCHASQGEGSVGPNLTDEHYKNVASITDIHEVLVNGAANNAMPAWGNRFHPNELVLLSSYVASLRGQNIPGRVPEGEVIPPWPTLEETDGSQDVSSSE